MSLRSQYGLFIGGTWVAAASGATLPTVNPATGRELTRFAAAEAEDIDLAVRNADAAGAPWRAVAPAERGRILLSVARLLRERIEELAEIETLDNGKPLTQSLFDVETAARYFEYYAGLADKLHGETIPLGEGYVSYTRQEPFGVVGVIVPWNAPLQQAARSIAPALVTANTVVAKPAEDTPLSCLLLAEIAAEAGVTPGVFNAAAGLGEVAGAAIVDHPLVRKVAFTGSVETGRRVAQAGGRRLIPLTLELGGKSANIVFEDADLDAAVAGALVAIVFNAGQVCSAGSRLLVHERIHDAFVARLREAAATVTVGDGMSDPPMGPLTTAVQRDKVLAYLRDAAAGGATFAVGSADVAPAGGGFFVGLTILTGVTPDMPVAREEVFGPVLAVLRFSDDEDAIRIANGTEYGLVAGIWTTDVSRAHSVAARLDAGQVYVNQYFAGGVETPFGGTKASGYGREKGVEAVRHYTQTKTVTIKL